MSIQSLWVLTKQLFHLVEETLRERVNFLPAQGSKLFQKLFLARREVSRCFHSDTDVLVSLTVPLNVFNSFAVHAKDLAGLGTGGNLHLDLAVQSRHVNICSQGGLHETYRHLTYYIKIVAYKYRMRLYLYHNKKITWRPSR